MAPELYAISSVLCLKGFFFGSLLLLAIHDCTVLYSTGKPDGPLQNMFQMFVEAEKHMKVIQEPQSFVPLILSVTAHSFKLE